MEVQARHRAEIPTGFASDGLYTTTRRYSHRPTVHGVMPRRRKLRLMTLRISVHRGGARLGDVLWYITFDPATLHFHFLPNQSTLPKLPPGRVFFADPQIHRHGPWGTA